MPHFGSASFVASPAQFGQNIEQHDGVSVIYLLQYTVIPNSLKEMRDQCVFVVQVEAGVVLARPWRACSRLQNDEHEMQGRIVIVERSDCMFEDKVRIAEQAGAVAVIVIGTFIQLIAYLTTREQKQ